MLEMSAVLGSLAGPVGSGGTVVQLTTQVVLLVVVIIFGFIGFRRGAQREFLVTVAVLFASVLVKVGHDQLVFWANRIHKLTLFVLRGGLGASDPSAAWAKIRALPDIINTAQKQLYLTLIVFVVIVFVAYLLGELSFRKKKRIPLGAILGLITVKPVLTLFSRSLGLILGVVNGYLILRFWLPRLFPAAKTVVVVPSGSLADFLGRNINYVFITIVAVLIVLGWQASTGRKKESDKKEAK